MKAYVNIPYIGLAADNESTTRNWARFSFESPEQRIDRRVIKRAIRRWGKYSLQRSIPTEEIRRLVSGRVIYEA